MPDAIAAEGTANRRAEGLATQVRGDLAFVHLGVLDGQLSPLLQQVLADGDRRRFSSVVGVCLEGKPEHGDAFTGRGAEQLLHHQLSDAVLLPAVELHQAPPVGRYVVEAVVTAEVHKVEDILLEAAATKTRT